ncbi:tetratricopeptide repeat protein [Bacillus suaedaesalsae]|uniref:Tetratricopeptide repeat protein n=1 Tax=Bacillus suaedaesalsae TaxID=2810349 RepID=A0ABS2DKZ9_9BACI|nr:tetratricopeptide repeat protein [Bacillus suaedaesalsae]MBM6619128.1 tetratricopeptide repeat protein [Bacillus suaedaesalsae]
MESILDETYIFRSNYPRGLYVSLLKQKVDFTTEEIVILGAFFPELLLRMGTNFYKNYIIQPFRLKMLSNGDKSKELMNRCDHLIEKYNDVSVVGVEQDILSNVSQNNLNEFLTSHFYYYSMNKWFWHYYEQVKHPKSHSLHLQAIDMTYFEKDLSLLRERFKEAFLSTSDKEKHQRLWNKLGVMLTLKEDYENAYKAIETSIQDLIFIEDINEKNCRHAESLNALALYYYRIRDKEKAILFIKEAITILNKCDVSYERRIQILKNLEYNDKILQK